MENDVPQISRWEGIKQYGAGYGVVIVLTVVFVYFAMVAEPPNAGYAFGQIFTATCFIVSVPLLFAWLGKHDTPKRRFALFLALWVIIMTLVSIGVFVA